MTRRDTQRHDLALPRSLPEASIMDREDELPVAADEANTTEREEFA